MNAKRIGEMLRLSEMRDGRSGHSISLNFAGSIARNTTEILDRLANRCIVSHIFAFQSTMCTGTQADAIFIPDMNL
jgi:hypothetical protein